VRVLLTTVPGEEHDLGLLMVECLFRLNGAFCIALGAQTPLNDIAMAAAAHRAEVLALPFSSAFPQRRILAVLRQCRTLLPEPVEIWAGGSGVSRIQPVRGIVVLPSLEQALEILRSRKAKAG
jgi:MerR family transcriptional regulator, light-induced transcriptional regulator